VKFLLPEVGLEIGLAVWTQGVKGNITSIQRLCVYLSLLSVPVAIHVISYSRKASERNHLFKQVSELMRKQSIKASDIFQCIKLNG